MESIKLQITGLPPCPRNRSHSSVVQKGRAMTIRTEAGRQYEKAIQQVLRGKVDLKFKDKFDSKKHVLIATFVFTTPDLYTKDDRLSQTSVDLDAHKILQDTLFGVVGLDDGHMVDERKIKQYGTKHQVTFILEIVERKTWEASILILSTMAQQKES